GPVYGEAAAGSFTGFCGLWVAGSSRTILLVMSETESKSILCPPALLVQRYGYFGPQEPASAFAAAVTAAMASTRVVAIRTLIRASPSVDDLRKIKSCLSRAACPYGPRRRDVQRRRALRSSERASVPAR